MEMSPTVNQTGTPVSVANRANDPLGSNCEGSGQLVDLRAAGVIVAFGTGIDRVAP